MRLIEQVWFDSSLEKSTKAKYWLVPLLLPFSLLFWLISSVRRLAYKLSIKTSENVSVPVVVVGNIGVGGNGKTPTVIYLIKLCQELGLKPGVISRGYGGNAPHYPYALDDASIAQESGDEPYLIYQRCQVPVVVGADRIASASKLVKLGCNIVIADDGMQHYRLQRDLEVIVIDGKRGLGNGLLLPAGPLREGKWRLKTSPLLILNGDNKINLALPYQQMQLAAGKLVNLVSNERLTVAEFTAKYSLQKGVNAAAGIGDPQRFFNTLKALKFSLKQTQGFVDHHHFSPQDFMQFEEKLPLLMTEKDAVKCKAFAQENWWYLSVDANFNAEDSNKIRQQIQRLVNKKTS